MALKASKARRPEPNLEVQWQRHLNQGMEHDEAAVTPLAVDVARYLFSDEAKKVLERGDLVVTISVRR